MISPGARRRYPGRSVNNDIARYDALNAPYGSNTLKGNVNLAGQQFGGVNQMLGQREMANNMYLEPIERQRFVDDDFLGGGHYETYQDDMVTPQGAAFIDALNPRRQSIPGFAQAVNPDAFNVGNSGFKAGADASEIAGLLIREKLQDPRVQMAVGGAAVGGGLLGVGINAAQDDSNGNILFNPITGAITAAGIGGLAGDQVAQYGSEYGLGRRVDKLEKSRPGRGAAFLTNNADSINARSMRNRGRGAAAGAGAGVLLQLMRSLGNDQNQGY